MKLNLNDYTFSVEIEFTGCSRFEAAKTVAEVLNTSYRQIDEIYDSYAIVDANAREWKILEDISLNAFLREIGRVIPSLDYEKCILLTPSLRYSDDISTLLTIVKAIRKARGFVNDNTKIRIRIGAGNHTNATIRNLANVFRSKQSVLYRALGLNPKRLECFEVLEYERHFEYRDDHIQFNDNRYYGITYHNYSAQKILEFRLFKSTLRTEWVRTYIILALAMNNFAIKKKYTIPKKTAFINEYLSFRIWLLQMGLQCSVYDTPRKLLLKNLEDNN